jgi:hypothetical protein
MRRAAPEDARKVQRADCRIGIHWTQLPQGV